MASYALQRSDHWLGEFYRRVKAKNGPIVATKETARKLALIFYDMIKFKVEFNPIPIEMYNQHFKERKLKYIKNQALKLGLNLVPMQCFLRDKKVGGVWGKAPRVNDYENEKFLGQTHVN